MGFLEDRDLSNVPGISEYFKGKSIFITGGTGFLGKVLIEKLLYSCTNLNKIYLLLRTKKGVPAEERGRQLYTSWVCFDRLRKERPGVFESKVVAIPGDIEDEGLGLSPADRKTLINNVDIVFHSAASVKFDDHLAFAVKLNLISTIEIVKLAKDMKKLSALIHISTSYSNTNRNPIDEVMYPPHTDWRSLIEVCKNIDHHTLEVLTTKFLGDMPNTYTFTKQLAEHVVNEQQGKLPAVIVRPSIVVSSVKEPMPGWIDNFNGPVALFIGYGKGIMKSVYSRSDLKSDYMPVDICVKNLIASAWIRGTKKLEPADSIPIYNCCANDSIQYTLRSIVDNGTKVLHECPMEGMVWNHSLTITASWTLHFILVIFKHLIPAIFIDILLRLFGKKPMLFKIHRKIYRSNFALAYFCVRDWVFEHANYLSLNSVLKEKDREQFDYDMTRLSQEEYIHNSVMGGKRFLMKEKDENLPNARIHFRRMWWLDTIVTYIFYAFVAWKLVNYISINYYSPASQI